MILVTRLNGDGFALNPDLIERADATPDTVVTLVDGTKYVIAESVPELVELVRHFRASVIAVAGALDDERRVAQAQTPSSHRKLSEPAGSSHAGSSHAGSSVVALHPRGL